MKTQLSKKRCKEFEELMLAKRRELIEEYNKKRNVGREKAEDGTEDYVDYAVHSYTKEFLLSLNDIERKVLRLIEEALARVESGTYGLCQECFKPISEKRLEAVPWARHCLECQELEEESLIPSVNFKRNR
jgi:DnaK suppressor protein